MFENRRKFGLSEIRLKCVGTVVETRTFENSEITHLSENPLKCAVTVAFGNRSVWVQLNVRPKRYIKP